MELKRQNEAKQDYIAPAQSFTLDDDGASAQLICSTDRSDLL